MKALILCSSDILGIPAIIQLQQQNKLHGVAVPLKASHILVPTLRQYGIAPEQIHVVDKATLTDQLKTLLLKYQPEVLCTFTFPWMIPDDVLCLLPDRCINFHFGLLPKYKGADPIFWQLKNKEIHGGISIHIMTSQIDAGPLLFKAEMPVIPGETYGIHTQRLGQLAAQTVIRLLGMLQAGDPAISNIPNEPAMYFKKPDASALAINWHQQTADEIECLVNASNPRYGGATTTIRLSPIRILEVAPVDVNNPGDTPPGTIVHADGIYGLIVACINRQYIKINVVHTAEGYLSGIKLFNLGFKLGESFV